MITNLAGMSTQPLGYDDRGRAFWRFPNSASLFISPPSPLREREPDRDSLLDMLYPGQRTTPNTDSNNGSSHDWILVSDLTVVAHIIELLGRSATEVNLRQALVLRYNHDMTQDTKSKAPAKVKEERKEAPDVDHVSDAPQGTKGNGDKEDESDDSDKALIGTIISRREKHAREATKKKGEGKPVKMRLVPDKGADVLPRYVIKEEKVFDDENTVEDSDSDGEDGSDHIQYFVFSRSSKCYPIALVDVFDKVVKLDKNSRVNVVFEIRRDDRLIAYTPVTDPWTDGIYYFSQLNFKRSGKYTLSFLIEGAQMAHIKPLIYSVVVQADRISCGPSCALDRLRAQNYLTHGDREISIRRRELQSEIYRNENEFVAVRGALLMVFLALPLGSLVLGAEAENSKTDLFQHVAEATGWNSNLDNVWRAAVLEAKSPVVLMECLLLLEYYISKNWLLSPAVKLLNSLPNPHFAIRCVTNSAVALRIYCLDKCIAYDRVQPGPRGSKAAGDGGRSRVVSGGAAPPPRKSRNSQAAKRTLNAEPPSSPAEVPYIALEHRPKRAASARAREALSATVRMVEQMDDDSDVEAGRRRGLRPRAPPRPDWKCHNCSTMNDARGSTCQVCGSRKPAGADDTVRLTRAERWERRKRDSNSESEEDQDADEYGSGGGRPEAGQRDGTLRKRSRVSYAEVNEEDEDGGDSLNRRTSPRARVTRIDPTADDAWSGDDVGHKEASADQDEGDVSPAEEEEEEPLDLNELISIRQSELEQEGDNVDSDAKITLLRILQKIRDDPDSAPFWTPIDTKIYTDYK
jgi:hypothetical protein